MHAKLVEPVVKVHRGRRGCSIELALFQQQEQYLQAGSELNLHPVE
jgi:hypothetical protein